MEEPGVIISQVALRNRGPLFCIPKYMSQRTKPSEATLWLYNCYPTPQEMNGHSSGSQLGSGIKNAVPKNKLYPRAKPESPCLGSRHRYGQQKQDQCNYFQCVVTAKHQPRHPPACLPALFGSSENRWPYMGWLLCRMTLLSRGRKKVISASCFLSRSG